MRRYRKTQAGVHARGVALYGSANEFLETRERDDLVELRLNLSLAHAKNRAVKKDIFHPSEVRMEPSGNLQQSGKAPVHNHVTLGGFHDAAQNFQRGAFSRAVTANDPQGFAVLDFERDVLERPKFTLVVGVESLPAEHLAS